MHDICTTILEVYETLASTIKHRDNAKIVKIRKGRWNYITIWDYR